MTYSVDFELVERIAPAVRARVKQTPIVRSEWLSGLHGGDVFLKCENLQLTGSFKVRGPFAKFADVDVRGRGVIAASAGNHGLGLAYAAREHGVTCSIITPRTIPAIKEKKILELGATLEKAPCDSYDDAQEYALARVGDRLWVSPFDDPHVIAGNGGTTALEILEELDRVDAIVAPCGGGGLSIGIGLVARRLAPDAAVIGVNSESSPGMWLSRRDRRAHLRVESKATIAEGIEGGVAENTYRLGLKYLDDVVVVSEDAIARAVAATHRREKMTIEGSAAAAVAAIVEGRVPKSRRRVVVVLTGCNIDPERLADILERNG